jgi:hypothetical protein
MKFLVVTVCAVVALVGCSYIRPLADEDKIKADLIGQQFPYAASLFGQQVWTIEADELKDWRVVRRATDRGAGTDVIYAAVRLEGSGQVISGDLKIIYRLYDRGWQLDKVVPDSEFSVSHRTRRN